MPSFTVQTYRVYDYSSIDKSSTSWLSYLALTGEDGHFCIVDFMSDEMTKLPEATKLGVNGFSFYYHHWEKQHLIDLLRNEKPVTVYFDGDSAFIRTAAEPVGEGEVASLVASRLQEARLRSKG